jgi:hypothetical protein
MRIVAAIIRGTSSALGQGDLHYQCSYVLPRIYGGLIREVIVLERPRSQNNLSTIDTDDLGEYCSPPSVGD